VGDPLVSTLANNLLVYSTLIAHDTVSCMLQTVYLFSIEDAWLTSGVGFNAANVVNIRGAQGGH